MRIQTILKIASWKQSQHDEKYHKDICILPVSRRLSHMVMHFSKYAGSLLSASLEKNEGEYLKKLIDMLIIIFSSSNIIKVKLECFVSPEDLKSHTTLDDLAVSYQQRHYQHEGMSSKMSVAVDIAIIVGTMNKALESSDHFEAYSYNESMITALNHLFRLTLVGLALVKCTNIMEKVADRLDRVEERHIHCEFLGYYSLDYKVD